LVLLALECGRTGRLLPSWLDQRHYAHERDLEPDRRPRRRPTAGTAARAGRDVRGVRRCRGAASGHMAGWLAAPRPTRTRALGLGSAVHVPAACRRRALRATGRPGAGRGGAFDGWCRGAGAGDRSVGARSRGLRGEGQLARRGRRDSAARGRWSRPGVRHQDRGGATPSATGRTGSSGRTGRPGGNGGCPAGRRWLAGRPGPGDLRGRRAGHGRAAGTSTVPGRPGPWPARRNGHRRRLAALVNDAVVLPGLGHNAHVEDPSAVLALANRVGPG